MSKLTSAYSHKAVSVDSVGNFEGQLLTLVESLGLRESQENAVKSLVRNKLWDWFHDQWWHAEIDEATAKSLFEAHHKKWNHPVLKEGKNA